MSDNKHNNDFFSNEITLLRRAWIESAVSGARSRIAESEAPDQNGFSIEVPAVDLTQAAPPQQVERRARPNLYVAWPPDRERRSGTR